ncbi:CRTAC1 family protein [Dyadobacter chenwenxiniae]|uniref:CRTAC1 family protein n=1 Tax=Dyadobacter chenwenxiniae TaxID=2906456 RepID=A0A9X1PHC7_9BACT|nr:CRTAC1 family protein [Dyadobacter chenwenxiniae]MCF0060661.1 CRTAC1 family protein [Dyadobacter chenwenxiniae]UON80495.1 CRTAC1 family protein [Dyadobacter chenwenxiniae]
MTKIRPKIILSILVAGGVMAMSLCKKPSSEEKMLQLLQDSKARVFNYQNNFSPEAQLAYLDSCIKTIPETEQGQLFKLNHFKANVLVQLGNAKEAITILKKLERDPNPIYRHIGIIRRVKDDLAVAYLRLGEQTNCITNHSIDACILPIKNGGVHRDMGGSKGTIGIYKRLLAERPDDLEALWLLNVAYMTLGKYPEGVPKKMLIPNLDKADEISVNAFQDIAPDLGLDVKNMAGGTIIDDFDNDGYLDLIMSSWDLGESMHYFRNKGDGSFEDRSAASGLDRFTGGLHIMQTDFNNDGLKDVFVMRGAWLGNTFGEQPNSLLKNNGDGTFTDVTIDSGLLSFHPTQTATWNDFNNDGWVDVFIGNETSLGVNSHPCELYLNNKNGTFTESGKLANAGIEAFVKGVTSGDYDNDGWNDIFLSTLSGKRILLKNKGISGLKTGHVLFEDVSKKAALDLDQNRSFTTWFFDYDNDGWLDILCGDYTMEHNLSYYAAAEQLGISPEFHGQPVVYKNNRDGTFSNVTRALGLDKTGFGMGGSFGDIDNDGFLDIFLGTGNPSYKSLIPNKMFKNVGGQSFVDVTSSAKVGSLQKGHSVGFGDMDNDGDQDIYIEMGGAYLGDAYQNSFFLNPGQAANNWISIDLEGMAANKAAIGSRLKITIREDGVTRHIYRDVNSGGSFGSAPFKREIGLGKATQIDEVEIKWNGSGRIQKIRNVAVNQFVKIKEGSNKVEKVMLKMLAFKNRSDHQIPVCPPIAKASI